VHAYQIEADIAAFATIVMEWLDGQTLADGSAVIE
jgi:hypothetical protein